MRHSTLPRLLATALLSMVGCANTKERYAYQYAYPTAPPVYTQPAGYATPAVNPAATAAVMPAPVGAAPPGAVVVGAVPAGVAVPSAGTALPPGAVLVGDTVVPAGAISEGPCPPMTAHGIAADGTLVPIAGESQSVPCPQEYVSEVVVPGAVIR